MTAFDVLVISSAVGWLLLIGLAVSVVRIEKAVVALQAEKQEGPPIGSLAPEITNDEGTRSVEIRSGEPALGLPRLVWFMQMDCGPCKLAQSLVGAIASDYKDTATSWVNYVGAAEGAEEFAREWGSLVRLVVDPARTNQMRWKIRRVPSVVLVRRDGIVAWKGAVSRKSVEEALNALNAEHPAPSRPKSRISI